MCGDADDFIRPKDTPRLADSGVVLAYMYAVCVAGTRNFDIVVDDKRHMIAVCDRLNTPRLIEKCGKLHFFLAKLYERRAAAHRVLNQSGQRAAAQPGAVGYSIKQHGTAIDFQCESPCSKFPRQDGSSHR